MLCFGPDRTIIWATLNFPGSWSNWELVLQLYKLLKTVSDGYSLASDSVFCRANMAGYIIRQLKSDEIEQYSSTMSVQTFIPSNVIAWLLSIHQSAE